MTRKYALTKVAPGDYLLPSNDGRTLWRISRYQETPLFPGDGPAGTFWGCWKFRRPIDASATIDPGDWNDWEFWEGMYWSRAEAIKAVLR